MRVVPHAAGYGIESKFSPTLVALARGTPGMKWDPGARVWAGSVDAVATTCEKLAAHGLRFDREILPTSAPNTFNGGVGGPLRGYQKAAVEFLVGHPQAILADAMGLGKTASALFAAAAISNIPSSGSCSRVLIVCPSYVRGVWVAEIAKWLPATPKVFLPKGLKPSPTPQDVAFTIIHYDILHAWAAALAAWGPEVCIFDEGHLLQSERSQRSKSARLVAEGAKYRWALTGTPLTNRPKDLWNLIDTLSPGRMGSFFDFGRVYCDAHQEAVTPTKTVWKFDGISNAPELAARLKYFMLRRTAADVSLELPPKTRQIVPIPVKGPKMAPAFSNPVAARRMLDAAADQKLPEAIGLIAAHIRDGARVVVGCYRRAVAELIAETLISDGLAAEIVHGGVGQDKRGTRIDRWRSSEAAALCVTIDSCSTGIDLTAGSILVVVELSWEPHDLLQLEARLHRYGAKSNVLIQYLIATGTGDEIIAARVVEKLSDFEQIIGTTGEDLGSDLAGARGQTILEELDAWSRSLAAL